MKSYSIRMFEPVVWRFDIEANDEKEAFGMAKSLQMEAIKASCKIVDEVEGIGSSGEQWYSIEDWDSEEVKEVGYNYDEVEE